VTSQNKPRLIIAVSPLVGMLQMQKLQGELPALVAGLLTEVTGGVVKADDIIVTHGECMVGSVNHIEVTVLLAWKPERVIHWCHRLTSLLEHDIKSKKLISKEFNWGVLCGPVFSTFVRSQE